jgi:hypothetical protein
LRILLTLNCGVLGAKDIPVFTYRENRGELVLSVAEGNPLGDAIFVLTKPRQFARALLFFRSEHPEAWERI